MSVMTEKLYASHLLLEMADDRLRANQRVVEQALHHTEGVDWEDSTHIDAVMVAMLRTAGLFVLDADECASVLMTLPPELPMLPPLPYPRMCVEMSNITEQGWQMPTPFAYIVSNNDGWKVTEVYEGAPEQAEVQTMDLGEGMSMTGSDAWEIPLIAIIERESRFLWDVLIPFQRQRPLYIARKGEQMAPVERIPQIVTAAFQVTPDGIVDSLSDSVDSVRQWLKEWVLRNVVNVAHILTARGVPHVAQPVGRPQRRRYEKRWGHAMPSIYRVDLHAASEAEEGPSSREYHVRWIQRGHWRHLAHGREVCTCLEHRWNPQPATWIDPMVKGPAGAPWGGKNAPMWKGRPVYYQRRPSSDRHER